jgi:hypothetical protein
MYPIEEYLQIIHLDAIKELVGIEKEDIGVATIIPLTCSSFWR